MGVYIGLDIGGTKCAAVAGALEGENLRILAREAFATPRSQEEAMDRLCALAEGLAQGRQILGVGISSGGPMDAERGMLCNPPNLPGWSGLSLTDYARARLHAPALLENDANACALAEWRFGAGRGSRLLLFLTFGTGLGAGIVWEGRILRGANGNAGELGHWRMADCGPAGYGKIGSFEGFCSGGGIAQLGRLYGAACAQRGEPAAWMEGEVTAKSLAEAARAGDAAAQAVFRESARTLGRGLRWSWTCSTRTASPSAPSMPGARTSLRRRCAACSSARPCRSRLRPAASCPRSSGTGSATMQPCPWPWRRREGHKKWRAERSARHSPERKRSYALRITPQLPGTRQESQTRRESQTRPGSRTQPGSRTRPGSRTQRSLGLSGSLGLGGVSDSAGSRTRGSLGLGGSRALLGLGRGLSRGRGRLGGLRFLRGAAGEDRQHGRAKENGKDLFHLDTPPDA